MPKYLCYLCRWDGNRRAVKDWLPSPWDLPLTFAIRLAGMSPKDRERETPVLSQLYARWDHWIYPAPAPGCDRDVAALNRQRIARFLPPILALGTWAGFTLAAPQFLLAPAAVDQRLAGVLVGPILRRVGYLALCHYRRSQVAASSHITALTASLRLRAGNPAP
jgi:hypothetical protein